MRQLAVVQEERTDGFSHVDALPNAIRLVGIPPGDANGKKLCHKLGPSDNKSYYR